MLLASQWRYKDFYIGHFPDFEQFVHFANFEQFKIDSYFAYFGHVIFKVWAGHGSFLSLAKM